MIRSLSRLCFAAAGATMLAAPAQSFTIEGGDASTVPKFDLEEQARNFQTPKVDLSNPNSATKFDLGQGGSLYFGVDNNAGMRPPTGFSPSGSTDLQNRLHYDRMFDPLRR